MSVELIVELPVNALKNWP